MLAKYSMKTKKWHSILYFLIDITLHVNELDLELQKEKLICDQAKQA